MHAASTASASQSTGPFGNSDMTATGVAPTDIAPTASADLDLGTNDIMGAALAPSSLGM
jgi:hypothetical protein